MEALIFHSMKAENFQVLGSRSTCVPTKCTFSHSMSSVQNWSGFWLIYSGQINAGHAEDKWRAL